MPEELRRQLTFLMRLWQAQSGGQLVWRISLEDAYTGTRMGFADLASLIIFLDDQTSDDQQTANDGPSSTTGEME